MCPSSFQKEEMSISPKVDRRLWTLILSIIFRLTFKYHHDCHKCANINHICWFRILLKNITTCFLNSLKYFRNNVKIWEKYWKTFHPHPCRCFASDKSCQTSCQFSFQLCSSGSENPTKGFFRLLNQMIQHLLCLQIE